MNFNGSERRHSICYIEFLRGKYDLSNTDYIQNLINCCSVDEKQSLLIIILLHYEFIMECGRYT